MSFHNIININEKPCEEIKFMFNQISDSSHYDRIYAKENFLLLQKWGLVQNMELMKFRFNINLDSKDLDKFIKDLFNDKNIKNAFPPLKYITNKNKKSLENFKFNQLNTNSVNMELFDVLYESKLCSSSNYIQKDYEDYFEEIHICDKLKQSLLLEDSEFYSIFNEKIRKEFLFHIFKIISIGGSLCQFEDYVTDYLNVTKCFYKDLVSAEKCSITGDLMIKSYVLEILNIEDSNIYQVQSHPQNFFYLIINPTHKHVHLWYHKWKSFW